MPSRIATHKTVIPGPTKHSQYAKYRRDPESNAFYSSVRWRKLRAMKLREIPLCERCRERGLIVGATIVHHRVELREDWSLGFDWDNLESICSPCHTSLHKQTK